MFMEVIDLDSILNSVKKKIGLDEEYEVFDDQVIDSINAAFFVLWQLGVGKDLTKPFRIIDSSDSWEDFIDNGMAESVRDYIYKKVKLIFDPPTNSFLIENLKEQIKEDEFRLPVAMDEYNSKKEGQT